MAIVVLMLFCRKSTFLSRLVLSHQGVHAFIFYILFVIALNMDCKIGVDMLELFDSAINSCVAKSLEDAFRIFPLPICLIILSKACS